LTEDISKPEAKNSKTMIYDDKFQNYFYVFFEFICHNDVTKKPKSSFWAL